MAATATAVVADRINSPMTAAPAAAMYALTILMGVRISRRQARAHWQAHRDVAEFMKSLAWQYMVHGGPFHSAVPDPDALFAERLEDRLAELRKVGWADPRWLCISVRESFRGGCGSYLLTEFAMSVRFDVTQVLAVGRWSVLPPQGPMGKSAGGRYAVEVIVEGGS